MVASKPVLTLVAIAGLMTTSLTADTQITETNKPKAEVPNCQEGTIKTTDIEKVLLLIEKAREIKAGNNTQESSSAIDRYAEVFYRGDMLSINTAGKHIVIHMFKPAFAEETEYKCKKDGNNFDWKELKVTRETKRIYNSGVKFDKKYIEWYRKSPVGLILQDLFFISRSYSGPSIMDKSVYKSFPLWNVILKDRTELDSFLSFLQTNFEKRGIKTFDQKPILFLNLRDDANLDTLDAQDLAKIATFFNLVDYKDSRTVDFFIKQQLILDDIIIKFEDSDPKYIGENTREQILRITEKNFVDFEADKLTTKFVAFLGAGLASFLVTKFWKNVWDFVWPESPKDGKATA